MATVVDSLTGLVPVAAAGGIVYHLGDKMLSMGRQEFPVKSPNPSGLGKAPTSREPYMDESAANESYVDDGGFQRTRKRRKVRRPKSMGTSRPGGIISRISVGGDMSGAW